MKKNTKSKKSLIHKERRQIKKMKIRRKFQETKQKIFLKIVKNENEKKETAK